MTPMRGPIVLIASLLAAAPAVHAWPTDPFTHVPVCTAPDLQHVPRTVSDGHCGAVVAWIDYRTGGIPDIYAQRLDGDGTALWLADGVALCTAANAQVRPAIAPDGTGGAIVAWIDYRGGQLTGDIFVQRVSGDGTVQWAANGVSLGAVTNDDGTPTANRPCIIADGLGGAIVAWDDIRGSSWDIYAQRVNASGLPQWASGGIALCSDPADQRYPVICDDGQNGAIVAWQDFRNGSTSDPYSQRVGAGGGVLWPLNGVALSLGAGSQTDLAIASDGASGATLAWYEAFAGDGITARRINALGVPQWAANGVPVCTFFSAKDNVSAVADGTGGLTIAWLDNRQGVPNKAVYSGRITGTGTVASPLAGIAVCTVAGFKDELDMVPDGANGALLAWQDDRVNPVEAVYAQRVSTGGNPLWNVNAVAVSLVDHSDTPVIASDGLGDGIITFYRATDLPHNDLYAARIGPSGELGGGCGAYVDFGDAPEEVTAYPSGVVGHFPTCRAAGTPGTREFNPSVCTALSTNPGSTGVVRHIRACGVPNPNAFWLGATVDGEPDGKVSVNPPAGAPSACDPAVPTDCVGPAYGWTFGQDECVGDVDSGVSPPNAFSPCSQVALWLEITNCQPTPARVFVNVLVDWNHDGDWNDDVLGCPGIVPLCAHEWAVKNMLRTAAPGSSSVLTPAFLVGPDDGPSWMRVTISSTPAGNDFPWAGATFSAGETEDYPTQVVSGLLDAAAANPPVEVWMGVLSPNPCRDGSDVAFALPRASTVSLAVYDAAGRRIRELARQSYPAGDHRAHWDLLDDAGRPVRAGFYLVRLHAGSTVLTRSVICAR